MKPQSWENGGRFHTISLNKIVGNTAASQLKRKCSKISTGMTNDENCAWRKLRDSDKYFEDGEFNILCRHVLGLYTYSSLIDWMNKTLIEFGFRFISRIMICKRYSVLSNKMSSILKIVMINFSENVWGLLKLCLVSSYHFHYHYLKQYYIFKSCNNQVSVVNVIAILEVSNIKRMYL